MKLEVWQHGKLGHDGWCTIWSFSNPRKWTQHGAHLVQTKRSLCRITWEEKFEMHVRAPKLWTDRQIDHIVWEQNLQYPYRIRALFSDFGSIPIGYDWFSMRMGWNWVGIHGNGYANTAYISEFHAHIPAGWIWKKGLPAAGAAGFRRRLAAIVFGWKIQPAGVWGWNSEMWRLCLRIHFHEFQHIFSPFSVKINHILLGSTRNLKQVPWSGVGIKNAVLIVFDHITHSHSWLKYVGRGRSRINRAMSIRRWPGASIMGLVSYAAAQVIIRLKRTPKGK